MAVNGKSVPGIEPRKTEVILALVLDPVHGVIGRADQILVIEDGRIVERGTHEELIGVEGRYHRLYTYQARI